ncbi:MAG: hypothetical protein ACLFPL_01165 [Candidatus Nanoarchaeia archaeon]
MEKNIILNNIAQTTPTFPLDKLENILDKLNEDFFHRTRKVDDNKRILINPNFNKNNKNKEGECKVGYIVFNSEEYSPVLLGLSGKHLLSEGGKALMTYKIDGKGRCSIPCCFYDELKERGFPSYDLFIGNSLFIYSPKGLISPKFDVTDYFDFS